MYIVDESTGELKQERPAFEKSVLVLILFSTLLLAIDSPLLDPSSGE